ncbi:MAG: rhodanese-like domain-containing protein [Candidatus Nitrosocosmicus sp.]
MANKINPKELQEKKDGYVIIDVRESDELDKGIIEGALNMPLGQLIRKTRQGDINNLKGKKICIYCSGGYRGNMAADELNNQGFDAVTIDGGYLPWKDKKNENKTSSSRNGID